MENTPLMRFQKIAQLLALSAALLLVGCGGGGGGGEAPTTSSPTRTVPPLPSDPFDPSFTPRTAPTAAILNTRTDAGFDARKQKFVSEPGYRVYWRAVDYSDGKFLRRVRDRHLLDINAHAAHARGATGKGEVVTVVDSGFSKTHIEFAVRDAKGKIISGKNKIDLSTQTDLVGEPPFQTPYKPVGLRRAHGTSVASLIAGAPHLYQELDPYKNRLPNMRGVAYDADLRVHQVYLGSCPAPCPYTPTNISKRTAQNDLDEAERYREWLQIARDSDAGVINFSFGRAGGIDTYRASDIQERFDQLAAALAQPGTPDAEKIIVVRSAGNAGRHGATSPELLAGIGIHFPKLQGHVLAVVATDNRGSGDQDLARFSNPCGNAKNFCIAAPGVDLVAAYSIGDDLYRPFSGTSAAAPLVSGGLALLRQFFRVDYADGTRSYQLGNTELVTRLLATADRTGRYSNSDKYGHGLLDLDAATAPVGELMTSLSTDPNARPFDASAFAVSGNAFGGAMRDALGDVKIAAFDELDAPFFFPLADGVSHAPQISAGHSDTLHEYEVALGGAANASLALSLAAGELSAARIRRGNLWFSYGHHGGREAGLYFGDDGKNAIGNFGMNFSAETPAENFANAARHFRAPLAFASPYLSLVRDGPGLGWSQPLRSGARFGFSLMHGAPQFDHFENPGGARGLGALFDFRPNNTSLSLQAGAVREADGFLGARAQGNFGEISADTAFAGIGGDWAALQNWRLLASAYLGHTKADTGDGMLRAADDIVSSAFSLGLARAGLARRGDWLGLRLSQPLRAESGAAHLRIPAGRTKYREVLHRQHKLELTPSGRNLQVEAEYRIPFAGGNLRAGLGFDRHANHDRARDLEGFLRLGFERRF